MAPKSMKRAAAKAAAQTASKADEPNKDEDVDMEDAAPDENADGPAADASSQQDDTTRVDAISVAIDVRYDRTGSGQGGVQQQQVGEGKVQGAQFAIALLRHDARAIEICCVSDSGNFPLLESILLQIAPNMDVALNACDSALPKQLKDKILAAVKQGVEDEEVMIHETTKGFHSKDAVVHLRERLLHPELHVKSAEHSLFDLEHQMKAVGGLIATNPVLNAHCSSAGAAALQNSVAEADRANAMLFYQNCSLKQYSDHNKFLKLDKAAFSALHILPTDKKDTRSNTSLLGFLNKCRTQMGTRRLTKWLRQPLTDEVEIMKRHDLVEAFYDDPELQQKVLRMLKQVVDLDRLILKLHRTSVNANAANGANLDDLYAIWRCLQSSIAFVEEMDTNGLDADDSPLRVHFLNPFEKVLQQFGNYCRMIEKTVDMASASDFRKKAVVNPNFDPQFQALRAAQQSIVAKMDDLCAKTSEFLLLKEGGSTTGGAAAAKAKAKAKAAKVADDGTKQVVTRVEYTIREDKVYAMRVVKKYHPYVMAAAKEKGYQSLSLKKAEFLFTTKELQQLTDDLARKDAEYALAQTELVKKCCKIAATYIPVLDKFSDLLATLDVLVSFALVASCSRAEFVRPNLVLDGEDIDVQQSGVDHLKLELKNCTHPLVQENQSESGGGSSSSTFVPNDCYMTSARGRFVTITGPNMGGKSTYIRQVALAVLLNQIGMFVPAEKAELSIFTSIFARVGASDAQLKGISTFMAEMLESSTILDAADARSLVIVDELGRGTSTQDGYGLAYAIAKYLCSTKKCFTLFATHFHELGELQRELGAAVLNKHAVALVDETDEKLTFLYEMRDGVADQSYGVHVAKLAKFPPPAVRSAKRTADFLERRAKKKLKMVENGTGSGGAGDAETTTSGEAGSSKETNPGGESAAAVVAKEPGSSGAGELEGEEKKQGDVDEKITKLLGLFGASSAGDFAQKLLAQNVTKDEFVAKVMGLCGSAS